MYRRARAALQQQGRRRRRRRRRQRAAAAAANVAATAVGRAAWRAKRRMRIPFHVTHCVFDRRSFQLYQEVRECARYFGCLEKMQQHCCYSSAFMRRPQNFTVIYQLF